MIYTVIAKPTKACNADCDYCSAPPDGDAPWTIEQFRTIWDNIKGQLSDGAVWIWHGGEPLLLSPDFYREAYSITQQTHPDVSFSVQSNLLLYKTKRWKGVFDDIFKGSVSTSFDPDEEHRTIEGSTEKYSKQFFRKIEEVMGDGYRPLVIGTYGEETAHLSHLMYDRALALGDDTYHLRFNYRYPAGRADGAGALITPSTYGEMLIEIYDRWIKDAPAFMITPLDQMLKKVLGIGGDQCPWTRNCGGKFISIMPNGDAYNCGEFSDLDDTQFRFGNVLDRTLQAGTTTKPVNIVKRVKDPVQFSDKLMSTPAARMMKRRATVLPPDCKTCRHFDACQGGCMRDSELFKRGLGGKFFYCSSWMMVFDRIKESIITGEANAILNRLGVDPEMAKIRARNALEDLA